MGLSQYYSISGRAPDSASAVINTTAMQSPASERCDSTKTAVCNCRQESDVLASKRSRLCQPEIRSHEYNQKYESENTNQT